MNRNEIATQLLMVAETGDSAVVNAEDYVSSNVDYNDLATRFMSGVEEIFDIFPTLEIDQVQFQLYEIGKRHFSEEKSFLKLWFQCLYSVFFGTQNGPRMGEFINIYGMDLFLEGLKERCKNPMRF